jgi:hypothetical protein
MIKVLEGLFGWISPGRAAKKAAPVVGRGLAKSAGDFRAVEIAPSIMCCKAAMQATGKSYLMRQAPSLPLMGCTMPTNCSCRFRKNADRRDSDRRLFGVAETNRWFVGADSRSGEGRRKAL